MNTRAQASLGARLKFKQACTKQKYRDKVPARAEKRLCGPGKASGLK